MGICWPGCMKKRPRRRIVLILIGLDNAGKTQTVNSLAGAGGSVLPTVGFKAVNLVHRDTPVTIYDLGGGAQFRQIWPQYFSEVHGVIFVVDSSDLARLDECRRALEEVVSHDRISGKPILILANKQDKNGALDDIDIVENMGIEPLVNRYRCPTLVESYTAAIPEKASRKKKLDPGLKKGYLWLLNYIVSRYGDINLRVQTDINAELERRKRQSAINQRASETYTTDCVETGFANPNYETLGRTDSSVGDSERIRALEHGVIVVKPLSYKSSDDNTVTIDSCDNSDGAVDEKPKSTEREVVTAPEKESDRRSKLSPIVRVNNLTAAVRSSMNRSGFRLRPQSSPSAKAVGADAAEINDAAFTDVDLSDVHDDGAHNVAEGEIKKNSELIMTETTTPPVKGVASDSGLTSGARTLPAEVRPASASQLVRKQLEVAAASHHRRRLSLRYGLHNKTSPEHLGLFHYEPSAKGRSGARLDKGDFRAADAPRSNDVTL